MRRWPGLPPDFNCPGCCRLAEGLGMPGIETEEAALHGSLA